MALGDAAGAWHLLLGQAVVALGEVAETLRVLGRELTAAQAPGPVALLDARGVHAGLAAELEHVLHGDDRQRGPRRVGQLDETPGRRLIARPAHGRVVVVRPRVDDR